MPWLGACSAGLAAGLVNALAGGGSLISFPALTSLGLPPLLANLTSTVALTPGYLGAAWAQRRDLRGQKIHCLVLAPAAALGGMGGALLLLGSDEKLFQALVPWLILLGSLLLALGDLPRRRSGGGHRGILPVALPVALAAVYGGYFGAGLSVILLAVLSLLVNETLNRLSGLKQLLALATNISASLIFIGSGRVAWSMALALGLGAIVGGRLGGALASRVNGTSLRWLIVALGTAIGLWYLIR
jgi:uncharacterized membrane protein YfcA